MIFPGCHVPVTAHNQNSCHEVAVRICLYATVLRKVPMMNDTARNRILRRAVLLASVPACMAAVLLYRAPIREFVSAVMSTETEQISGRIDRLSAAGTDRMFRRSASKRPVAGVE